jgi:uncharacterized Zn finger protein
MTNNEETSLDTETLQTAIGSRWLAAPSDKARCYVGKFFQATLVGSKIVAKVEGNHGIYVVSIDASSGRVSSACSCYIGKGGFCHHCEALAHTFLRNPDAFQEIQPTAQEAIQNLAEVQAYLQGVTLETLLAELKANGITQTAFAASIGVSTRHLSAVKLGELRNHFFNELGSTKLACLWVLEHVKQK